MAEASDLETSERDDEHSESAEQSFENDVENSDSDEEPTEDAEQYPEGKEMIGDALFEMFYCGKRVKTVKPLTNNKPVENWPHVTYLLLDVQEHTDTGEIQIFTKLYKNETSGVHVEHVLYDDKEQVYKEIQNRSKGKALTIRLIMNYSPCNENKEGKKCCEKLKDLFKYMTQKFKVDDQARGDQARGDQDVKYVVEFTQLYHVKNCKGCGLIEITDNKNGLRKLNNIQDHDVKLGTINWPNLYSAITHYISGIELLESNKSYELLDVLRPLYNDILYKILFLEGEKPGKKLKVFVYGRVEIMQVKVTSLNEDPLKYYLTKHTEQGKELEAILNTDS